MLLEGRVALLHQPALLALRLLNTLGQLDTSVIIGRARRHLAIPVRVAHVRRDGQHLSCLQAVGGGRIVAADVDRAVAGRQRHAVAIGAELGARDGVAVDGKLAARRAADVDLLEADRQRRGPLAAHRRRADRAVGCLDGRGRHAAQEIDPLLELRNGRNLLRIAALLGLVDLLLQAIDFLLIRFLL